MNKERRVDIKTSIGWSRSVFDSTMASTESFHCMLPGRRGALRVGEGEGCSWWSVFLGQVWAAALMLCGTETLFKLWKHATESLVPVRLASPDVSVCRLS